MGLEPEVKLRAVELFDVDLLYNWENNLEMQPYGGNPTAPFSKLQLTHFVECNRGDLYSDLQMRLILELVSDKSTEVVGIVDVFDFEPYHNRAGVGIIIHKSYREQGLAKKALSLLTNYLFTTWGVHQLWAIVATNNLPSIALFEGCNFEKIGIKRDWLKVGSGYQDAVEFQIINLK